MTTKKSTPDRPAIDLDRVLASRTPDFTLGGIQFEGRPIAWTAALEFDSKRPAEQLDFLLRALRARTSDPEALTDDWIGETMTRPAIDLVVGILFRAERPTER